MKTIYKYPLPVAEEPGVYTVELPSNFEPLSLQVQNGVPCLWGKVDPENISFVEKRLVYYATGQPLQDVLQTYLGTIQLFGGSLVWHVYEIVSNSTDVRPASELEDSFIGQTLDFIMDNGEVYSGEFKGFDADEFLLHHPEAPSDIGLPINRLSYFIVP